MQVTLQPHEGFIAHRNTKFDAMLIFNDTTNGHRIRFMLDGIQVIAVRLVLDNNWWIIPRLVEDDYRFTDMGPFETQDSISVHLALTADKLHEHY